MYEDEDEDSVYWQHMGSMNDLDLIDSMHRNEIFAIVDETHGGIIAYAIGTEHANTLVVALRSARKAESND